MQSLHRQLQRSTCNDKETKTEEKEENVKNYGKNNKELNALIEKKFHNFFKNKKRMKTENKLQHFQEIQISDNESKKRVSQALPRA